MLGNHIPRQCGIATFTTDLSDALTREFSNLDCFVVAMNDAGRRHAYPARVRLEIPENDVASYRRAADFINASTVDVVCMQHEYGIFGGKPAASFFRSSASCACPSSPRCTRFWRNRIRFSAQQWTRSRAFPSESSS